MQSPCSANTLSAVTSTCTAPLQPPALTFLQSPGSSSLLVHEQRQKRTRSWRDGAPHAGHSDKNLEGGGREGEERGYSTRLVWCSSSLTEPTRGIMMSGIGLMPLPFTFSAACSTQHKGATAEQQGRARVREEKGRREDMREHEEGDRPQGGEQMDGRESEQWGGEKWGKSMRQELTAMPCILPTCSRRAAPASQLRHAHPFLPPSRPLSLSDCIGTLT
jgi:hypothetical protein